MATFARLEQNVVAEIVNLPEGVSLAEAFHQDLVFVPAAADTTLGMIYAGGKFSAPAPYIPSWDEIRVRRDLLLARSDWTQLPDAVANKDLWATYRHALRNLPQEYTSPADVVWPNPPV